MTSVGLGEDSVYFHVQISVWCAKTAESGLVPRSRGIVLIVVNISSRIWASTLPYMIWSSRSYGDVRSRGVSFGRGWRKIVWII